VFRDKEHYRGLLFAILLMFGAGQTTALILKDQMHMLARAGLTAVVISTLILVALIVRRILREERALALRESRHHLRGSHG